MVFFFFFFNDTATTEIYTLSLHDALPIRLGARAQPTIVVFGEQGSEPILGVVTLEEFRLAVDPVNHRLISVPGRLGAAVVSLSLTRSEHACHPERRRREGSAC